MEKLGRLLIEGLAGLLFEKLKFTCGFGHMLPKYTLV